MRRFMVWMALAGFLATAGDLSAATGRVIKVLPQYLDRQGRASLSPSLYERDAYQVVLRDHPDRRSGIRYAVHWKTKGDLWEPLRMRLELRGIAEGNLPRSLVLEETVKPGGWLGNWTMITLAGEKYKAFGAVTAWRVTLWEGEKMLGEQKSFLW